MSKQWVKEEVKKNEVADALERGAHWVRYHRAQATWGGVAVLAVALAVAGFFVRRGQAHEQSWASFATASYYAQTGQAEAALNQVKALAESHPGHPAAGYGRLLAADVLFEQGNYKEAAQAYQGAADAPGSDAQAPLALSGLALAQEGAGECPAAMATSQRFLDAHSDHFLAPLTHAVLARCQAASGKTEEAKATFQRIEILYPQTYWEAWAKARKG